MRRTNVNTLCIDEGNLVARTTQLCGNMAFSPILKENAISQRETLCGGEAAER
jgi:hypothetical protein